MNSRHFCDFISGVKVMINKLTATFLAIFMMLSSIPFCYVNAEDHVHTEECYAKAGDLLCTILESEEHTHTVECYAKGGELICGETQEIITVSEQSNLEVASEEVIEVSDFDSIKNIVESLNTSDTKKSGTIKITSNISFTEILTIPSGVSLTIIGDETNHIINKTADASGSTTLITIESGAKLTLDGDLTLQADKNGDSLVECYGEFTLKNGMLDFNDYKIPAGEGIVIVKGNNAKFTMDGGLIQNATINACSGGVRISGNGTFTMNGGTISGIKAGGSYQSGAVLAFASDDSLGNGTATFTMNGGIIENNSGYRGAGVSVIGNDYVRRAYMTMNGGEIRNNKCQGSNNFQAAGGGIYIERNAEVTMNDGKISGNEVNGGEGGGICTACGWEGSGWDIEAFSKYYPAAFTMNGGTISDNHAKMNLEQGDNGCGGGIYIASNRVTLNGGVIENNTAEKQGGGVYVGATPYVLKMYNAVVKENHATILGGGLWACPTGDVELFVNNGAALYDNSSDGAGDDIASVKMASKNHTLTLSNRALGGGQIFWYKDGGIDNINVLGYPDNSARYNADTSTPIDSISEYGESIALKAIMSDGAKAAAMGSASLIIQGNEAPRGGGIGTNGAVVLGDSKKYDYTLQVKKTWTDTEDNQKVSVSVSLKVGDYVLDSVTLNKENNWTAEFNGLPDPKTLGSVSYAIIEDPIPDNFTPSYTEAEIDEDTRTIYITLDNKYTPTVTPTPTPTVPTKNTTVVYQLVRTDTKDEYE